MILPAEDLRTEGNLGSGWPCSDNIGSPTIYRLFIIKK